MSNRPRRRWLREQRLRVIVEARIEAPPEEFIRSMADWNGWLRSAFRSIERTALRPDRNLRGEAGRLQNIQICNKPGGFDLLNDHPEEWPEDLKKEIDALDRLRGRYEEAVELFYRARDGLEPLRRVARRKFEWDVWGYDRIGRSRPIDDFVDERDHAVRYLDEVADFTAAIYRAIRILRYNFLAIHQHSPTYGHATTAARSVLLWGTVTRGRSGRCLNDKAVLPEAALLRVLALCAAHRACGGFWRLAEDIVAAGGAIDLGDHEYVAGDLKDAEKWCEKADGIEATEREAAGKKSRDGKHAASHRGPVGSVALRQFAADLRHKFPDMKNDKLFHHAVVHVSKGPPPEITVEGQTYRITVDGYPGPDPKLVSHSATTGRRHGRPVGLRGWRDWGEVKRRVSE